MYKTLLTVALLVAATTASAEPWKYSGSLNDAGAPANGRYDLRLTLLDANKAMSIGTPVTLYAVNVNEGAFTVDVDFGIDLANAPVMQLKTEVSKGSSGFVALGEPTRFDPKAALAGVCWDTEGNSGTSQFTNFIGTTDNTPLFLSVNSARVLKIWPQTDSPNFVAGHQVNTIDLSKSGQVIAGGGNPYVNCGVSTRTCKNSTSADYATVSGGSSNVGGGAYSVIGGGSENDAGGTRSVVGGGYRNRAISSASAVNGGELNTASGERSTIGGGYQNTASGQYSAIGGGDTNTASGQLSGIFGGSSSLASGTGSIVLGGVGNTAAGFLSAVIGGEQNIASGANSQVAGGQNNCAGGDFSWVGGIGAHSRAGNEFTDLPCSGSANSGDSDGDQGTFIWADQSASATTKFISTGPNQFLVRATGGVGINTTTLGAAVNLRSSELVIRNGAAGDNTDITLINDTNRGYNMVSVPGSAGAAGSFFIGEVDARLPAVAFANRLQIAPNGDLSVYANAFKPGGGAWAVSSDARLKRDVSDLEGSLARLLALHGVNFSYRDDAPKSLTAPGPQIGFIAQEVEKIFPQWISERGGYKTVGITGFEALTVEAMRDLKAESDVRMEALEKENAALRARLDALEAKVSP